jgi:hypothetical protein
MYRVDSTPAADRSIQIGPRVLERAVDTILRGTGAALLPPWKLLLKRRRHGWRCWDHTLAWRLAAVQYASAIGVWALARHPFYAGVNLSSGVCVLLLVYALASHKQGKIRSRSSGLRHKGRGRRWRRAAFQPAYGACGVRLRRSGLRAIAR